MFAKGLDKIDRKLLIVLTRNARLSQQQLSKLVGASRDVVGYRIRKLEERGIIYGYVAHTQNRLFGIENYTILVKLQHTTASAEESILRSICQLEHTKLVLHCRGDYDIAILAGATNKIHLTQIVDSISATTDRHLRELDLCINVKVLKYEDFRFLEDFTYEGNGSRQLSDAVDQKDLKIIKLLAADGKMHVLELAQKIDLSAEQTSVRLKRLLKIRAITNTQAIIDFTKMGYERYLILLKIKHYTRNLKMKLRELFRQQKTIIHAERFLGRWDLRLDILAEDHASFLAMFDAIKIFLGTSLADYSVCTVLEEEKRGKIVKRLRK